MKNYEQLQEFVDGPPKDCLYPLPPNEKARVLLHHIEYLSDWMIEDLDTEQDQDDRYRFSTWVEGESIDTVFGHALVFERPTSLEETSTYYSQAFRYFKVKRDDRAIVEQSRVIRVRNDVPGPENIDETVDALDPTQLIYAISIANKIRKQIKYQKEPGEELDFPVEVAICDQVFDFDAEIKNLEKELELTRSV